MGGPAIRLAGDIQGWQQRTSLCAVSSSESGFGKGGYFHVILCPNATRKITRARHHYEDESKAGSENADNFLPHEIHDSDSEAYFTGAWTLMKIREPFDPAHLNID